MSDQPSIAELMSRDPNQLTDANLDTIIAELRSSRHRFVTAGDKKVGTPEARKSKAQQDREARAKILESTSLDDLFKDL